MKKILGEKEVLSKTKEVASKSSSEFIFIDGRRESQGGEGGKKSLISSKQNWGE